MNQIEEVLIALRRVIRATDIYSRRLTKTTGLTAPQLLLLQTLAQEDGITIGVLAKRMSLSQATVTTIVDRLEKRALLARHRDVQDRRRVQVWLTDNSNQILDSAPIPLQDQFARQFEALKPWEKSLIVASLQRVAEMMDAQDLDASPYLNLGDIVADSPGGDKLRS